MYRVYNGHLFGASSLYKVGDMVANVFATPHLESVVALSILDAEYAIVINEYNDVYRRRPDAMPSVAVIDVDEARKPRRGECFGHNQDADRDQMIVTSGTVVAVYPVVAFLRTYCAGMLDADELAEVARYA